MFQCTGNTELPAHPRGEEKQLGVGPDSGTATDHPPHPCQATVLWKTSTPQDWSMRLPAFPELQLRLRGGALPLLE